MTEKYCDWTLDYAATGTWKTECKNLHSFIFGGLKENKYEFCPHCGKPVREKPKRNPLALPKNVHITCFDANMIFKIGYEAARIEAIIRIKDSTLKKQGNTLNLNPVTILV